jgi:Histone methylation protein DOT1
LRARSSIGLTISFRTRTTSPFLACVVLLCATTVVVFARPAAQPPFRPLDAVYIPTPSDVVTAMLQMAQVGSRDVVFDLGSGDGRIVIAAVKEFGAARGVGVELDPARVLEATALARKAGVHDRVEFRQQDLFETDLREATVVTLYLGNAVDLQLRPKLLAELKPGARVVSHAFDMGDWVPDETRIVSGRRIFLWTIPQ